MSHRIILSLLACALIAGCSVPEKKAPEPEPVIAEKPRKPDRRPEPAPPGVAVLVSQDIAPYTEVAERLVSRLGGRGERYTLGKTETQRQSLIARLEEKNQQQLVTIGLDASLLGKRVKGRQQVFCQVFNYTGYKLPGKNRKGVSMLPGADRNFSTWKALSPLLTDVAVITGAGLEDMLQHAEERAAAHGITLHRVVVKNDKEYLYSYKQLAEKVQGYWLLPDNRVLSVRTLKDVMTFSVRNGKQVVVFSDELLKLGGLFSVASDYQDIADKVLIRLEQAAHKKSIPGPVLMPLDKAQLKINAVMVQRLGLKIPPDYREYAGESRTP